jgi:hypothetical protein
MFGFKMKLGLGNKVLLPEYGQKKVPDLEQFVSSNNPIFAQLVIYLNLVLVELRLGLKNHQVGEKWVSDDCSYLCKKEFNYLMIFINTILAKVEKHPRARIRFIGLSQNIFKSDSATIFIILHCKYRLK